MSGNFKNDIKTTGFVKSSKIGPLIGSVEELPTPSAEYEGITLQYLGETVSEFLRKSNMYICKKQADDTYAWEDNSPAGGGKWGKIIGNVEDQTDLVARIQAILDNAAEDSTHTWTASQLKAKFAALAGVASVVVVPSMPSTPVLNTIYYVGTESPYHIWLYAKNESGEAKWFDFGTTEISLDDYYTKDTVDDKFDDEVAARDAAIAVEKTARENAVNAEITARTNAVSAEATTRESADAALQVNIDKKQNKSTLEVDVEAKGFTKNQGTITEIKLNGVSMGTAGLVNLENVVVGCPFPVGCIMPMAGNQNPNQLWDGTTWNKLADGTFLMADSAGGKVSVSAELPQHTHKTIKINTSDNYKLGYTHDGTAQWTGVVGIKQGDGGAIYRNDLETGSAEGSTYVDNGKVIPTGTIKVVMWERIA